MRTPTRRTSASRKRDRGYHRYLSADKALPKSKDLRDGCERWWTIGSQGDTGSCAAWAVADSVLRWHFVRAGKLKENQRLSVRYVWMAAKELDRAQKRPTAFIDQSVTTCKAALDVAKRFGVVRENVLPFTSRKLYTRGSEEVFYARAREFKIANYYVLPTRSPRMIDHWRRWLAFQGPIVAALYSDYNFMAPPQNGRLESYNSWHGARGGHAVAIVGYDADGFIVRNSCGTTWGNQGYLTVSTSYAHDAFFEAYGVVLGKGAR